MAFIPKVGTKCVKLSPNAVVRCGEHLYSMARSWYDL